MVEKYFEIFNWILSMLGKGGLRFFIWISFIRRGELVNLGWGLVIVFRFMDLLKGFVFK